MRDGLGGEEDALDGDGSEPEGAKLGATRVVGGGERERQGVVRRAGREHDEDVEKTGADGVVADERASQSTGSERRMPLGRRVMASLEEAQVGGREAENRKSGDPPREATSGAVARGQARLARLASLVALVVVTRHGQCGRGHEGCPCTPLREGTSL